MGKTIKVKDLGVTAVESIEDFDIVEDKPKVKKSKASTKSVSKSAVSDKAKSKNNRKSKDKNTKKAAENEGIQCPKTRGKLVEKKAKQSGAEVKEKKNEKIKVNSDTSETKEALTKKKASTKKTASKASEPVVAEEKDKKTVTKSKKASRKTTKKPSESAEAKLTESVADIIKRKLIEKKSEAPVNESKTTKTESKPNKKENKPTKKSGTDLLISFDTTGSMYSVLAQVREEVDKLVKDMQNSVENLRVGIIAHGDYCDAGHPYTIRVLDFTDDIKGISKFIKDTESTYGGDADECYELVLNTAYTQLSWRENVNRILVMIGDANPHEPEYSLNKHDLDWRIEADHLNDNEIKVFAVHALSYYRRNSRYFYDTVAKKTNGAYLTLDQFSEVSRLILATCVSQYSIEKLDEYVEIIRNDGNLTNTMARNINRLYGKEVITGIPSDYFEDKPSKHKTGKLVQKDGLIPVMPGRFQTMKVTEPCDIRGFVEATGIKYKKGRAFYELSKAETVQQYKEVIIQDRATGEMFNGSQVREYLGLQPQVDAGGVKERLHKDATKDFRVFVQSTSVNRKLVPETLLLYEVEDV